LSLVPNTADEIFTINTDTGLAYEFISTEVPFQSVGIAFDESTNLLLASNFLSMYNIDPADGTTIFLGNFDHEDVDDLAHSPVRQ